MSDQVWADWNEMRPSRSNTLRSVHGEGPMLRKSTQSSAGEPSFFYLMMAESCFRRAASTRNPTAGETLRDIGRKYLVEANDVTSALEAQPSQSAAPLRFGR
jgi:hypothetical protein